jgi:hypothetical protein
MLHKIVATHAILDTGLEMDEDPGPKSEGGHDGRE